MPDVPETIIPPASGASSPAAPGTIIAAPGGGGSSPTAPSTIVAPASAGSPPTAPQTVTPQSAGTPATFFTAATDLLATAAVLNPLQQREMLSSLGQVPMQVIAAKPVSDLPNTFPQNRITVMNVPSSDGYGGWGTVYTCVHGDGGSGDTIIQIFVPSANISGQTLKTRLGMRTTIAGDTWSAWTSHSDYVLKSGAQTISGPKTFTSGPVVPTLSVGDNTGKASSTEFVNLAIFNRPLVGAKATNSANTTQNLAANVWAILTCFDNELWDSHGWLNSSGRFQPNKAGYYEISAIWIGLASISTGIQITALYKNGIRYSILGRGVSQSGTVNGFGGSDQIYLNGTTDYIEIWGFQSTGGSVVTSTTAGYQRFSAQLIGI